MKANKFYFKQIFLLTFLSILNGKLWCQEFINSSDSDSNISNSFENVDSKNLKPTLNYSAGKNYILVERTDLRRYDNGKYIGLTSREIRSFIRPSKSDSEFTFYDGDFFVWQETRRNMNQVSNGLNDAIPSKFKIDLNGNLEMIEDNGFPSFRSFPSFSKEQILPGDVWHAEAERSVDPKNSGCFTRLPIYVEYKYLRDDFFHDEEVFILSAKWATRYGGKILDFEGDENLSSATGMHNATITVSKATGKALVIRDTVDETFSYIDGLKISYKGSISLFTEYPPSYDSENIFNSLQKIAALENKDSISYFENFSAESENKISVEKTNSGIRLRLKDLQFYPDSAKLLPGEENRLDSICKVLAGLKNQMLLVEGHTARVGDESNELSLSLERAHTIAEEMIKRGINKDKIICKGSGGNKPVADNSTEEGRALNRRVEITILE